jgi:hypothetical protein
MIYQGQDWLNAWLLGGGSSPTRGALGLRPEVPTGLWPTGACAWCSRQAVLREAMHFWVGGSLAYAPLHPQVPAWT